MKPFNLIPILKNRCAKIEKHYNNLLEDFDAEEIHAFRLNIKKLKSFLELLNADVEHKKAIRLPKSLQNFYTTVGSLRNLQLHRQEIEHLCEEWGLTVPQNYLQILKTAETKAGEAARALALEKPLRKHLNKMVAACPTSVTEATVTNFVASHNKEVIKLLLTEEFTDECLHRIRKLLKHLLYTWQYVEALMDAFSKSTCADKGSCIAITDLLGDHQNQGITLTLLHKYFSDDYKAEERTTLQRIVQHTLETKQQTKDKIVQKLQRRLIEQWAIVAMPITREPT